MGNRLFTTVGALVLGLGILAATTQGCGSNSGTPSAADINAVCNKGCMTGVRCSAGFLTMDQCVAKCTSGAKSSTGATCKNLDAIVAKANSCANMTDCTAFAMCFNGFPECDTSGAAGNGGGAGTSGGAGTTGAGGFNFDGGFPFDANAFDGGFSPDAGGSTCATACVKADSCCNALTAAGVTGADNCDLKATCDGAGANASSVVAGCNGYLLSASFVATAQGKTVPDACK
jgi:hypothetical protein